MFRYERGGSMRNTPVFDMLERYRELGHISFAMPGHKGGHGFPAPFLEHICAYDVTELAETDSLHAPREAIREAMRLAAAFYGAEETFFLVNGSTAGIHCMLAAACRRGGKVLVNRGCHMSLIHACILFGLEPVYIPQGLLEGFGVPAPVTPEQVKAALGQQRVQAVLLTSPNFYGLCADLEKIAAIAHAHKVPLLVDEAHGAHFAAAEVFPQTAIRAGADMAVQSAHKTLNALNQSAFLHIKSDLVDKERLRAYTVMLQTSSPSYPMVAAMDLARAELAGKNRWEETYHACVALKRRIARQSSIRPLTAEGAGGYAVDETRLVFNFSAYQTTGFEGLWQLAEREIDAEMADLDNVVCIATAANTAAELHILEKALLSIAEKLPPAGTRYEAAPPPVLEQALPPADAFDAPGVYLPLKQAAGRISKTTAAAYPPGVPVIACGERVTAEAIAYLFALQKAGAEITGLREEQIEVVK